MKALSVCGYPGGKVKAVPFLLSRFPRPITEFREIFCGGGSVSLAVMQRYPKAKFWMNDLHYPIYAFWRTLRERPHDMVRWLLQREREYAGRSGDLFAFCRSTFQGSNELETACKWWIGQKLGFSGMGLFNCTASYASGRKFNAAQIMHLLDVAYILKSVNLTVTNCDYSTQLGSGLTFADPPYLIRHNHLYGKSGELHRRFDHQAFALRMKSCDSPWLITLNDCDAIRTWYSDFTLEPLDLQYIMGRKAIGQELIITNYDTAANLSESNGVFPVNSNT